MKKTTLFLWHEISFLLKKSINISSIQCKTSLSLCGQRSIKKSYSNINSFYETYFIYFCSKEEVRYSPKRIFLKKTIETIFNIDTTLEASFDWFLVSCEPLKKLEQTRQKSD